MDNRDNTAAITIAQAAAAQLNGLTYLLEAVICALDQSMRERQKAKVEDVHLHCVTWKYRNYFPSTALVAFTSTSKDEWIIGVENRVEALRQLQLDLMYVLNWVNSVFYTPNDQNEKNMTVVQNPLSLWQRKNITLSNLSPKLGLLTPDLAVYEPASVVSQVDRRGSGCWRSKIQ
jgi:hypothetical protein